MSNEKVRDLQTDLLGVVVAAAGHGPEAGELLTDLGYLEWMTTTEDKELLQILIDRGKQINDDVWSSIGDRKVPAKRALLEGLYEIRAWAETTPPMAREQTERDAEFGATILGTIAAACAGYRRIPWPVS